MVRFGIDRLATVLEILRQAPPGGEIDATSEQSKIDCPLPTKQAGNESNEETKVSQTTSFDSRATHCFVVRCHATLVRFGRHTPFHSTRAPLRTVLANGSKVAKVEAAGRRTTHLRAVSISTLQGRAEQRGMRRAHYGDGEPLFHWRASRGDTNLRLARCLDRFSQRICSSCSSHRGRSRCRQLRA